MYLYLIFVIGHMRRRSSSSSSPSSCPLNNGVSPVGRQVILFIKPLEDGQVVLRGVSVEVLSLVTVCRVDKWGRGISRG